MLAFDRERVRLLAQEVHLCVDELARCTGTDPLSVAAAQAAQQVRRTLSEWACRLDALATCTVMEERASPFGLERGVFDRAVAATRGWVTIDEPGRASALRDLDVVALVRSLDQDGVIALVTRIVGARADRETGRSDEGLDVAALDRLLGLVAGTLDPLDPDGCGPTEDVLGRLSPEAAGLLLAQLTAGPETLALWAVEVLSSWLHRAPEDVSAFPHDSPADHLFAVLARSGEAARAFLARVADHPDGWALLTDTAVDPAGATAVVLTATDPAGCDIAVAGGIVRPYVAHVLDEYGTGGRVYDTRYADLLGAVVSPWLLQMTSRAQDWGWSEAEATEELQRVIHDADSMRTLAEARDRWQAGLVASVGAVEDETPLTTLADVSGMFGWLDAILHEEEVADDLADRVVWDLGWSAAQTVSLIAAKSVTPDAVSRRAASVATSSALGRLRTAFERNGWWGAPPTMGATTSDGDQRHDWRRTTLAAATATATVEALQATGVLSSGIAPPPGGPAAVEPGGSCTSDDWLERFESWLATELDEPARTAVHDAVSTMLNPYQAAEACEQILD